MKLLRDENPYPELDRLGEYLESGINSLSDSKETAFTIKRIGGVFTIFFTDSETISNLDDVKNCDMNAFSKYFHGMLEQGIYISPSQYEVCFISAAHNKSDIDAFIDAFDKSVS